MPDEPPSPNEKLSTIDSYKIAADASMKKINESWLIFSIFWAATALLLVALFQSTDSHFVAIKWIVIPMAGLILSITWSLIQYRVLGWVEFYEKIVNYSEDELNPLPKYRIGETNPNKVKGFSIRWIMRGIPILGVAAWIFILGFGLGFGLCYTI